MPFNRMDNEITGIQVWDAQEGAVVFQQVNTKAIEPVKTAKTVEQPLPIIAEVMNDTVQAVSSYDPEEGTVSHATVQTSPYREYGERIRDEYPPQRLTDLESFYTNSPKTFEQVQQLFAQELDLVFATAELVTNDNHSEEEVLAAGDTYSYHAHSIIWKLARTLDIPALHVMVMLQHERNQAQKTLNIVERVHNIVCVIRQLYRQHQHLVGNYLPNMQYEQGELLRTHTLHPTYALQLIHIEQQMQSLCEKHRIDMQQLITDGARITQPKQGRGKKRRRGR